MPVGRIGSLGGSASRSALERCLHSSYDSLPALPGNDFIEVQRYITGEIASLARARKLEPSLARSRVPEQLAKVKAEVSRDKTRATPVVESQRRRSAPVKSELVPPQVTRQPSLPIQQKKQTARAPQVAPAAPHEQVAPVKLEPAAPAVKEEAKVQKPVIRGLGRGAKNLAALMKRAASSTPPARCAGCQHRIYSCGCHYHCGTNP
jgi:hypothetical protein